MSRSRYRPYRSHKWPGWALRLFVNKPFRRRTRAEERKILSHSDLESFVFTHQPKKDWWD